MATSSSKQDTYVSHELFHLVGRRDPYDHEANYEALCKILSSHRISYPPHEPGWGSKRVTIDWRKSLENGDLLVPTVVCFADIPRQCLNIHARKYGHFGIGLRRDSLIYYGARPVTYIPMRIDDATGSSGKTLIRDIEAVYRSLYEHFDRGRGQFDRLVGKLLKTPEAAGRAATDLFQAELLAFIKPFNSHLPGDHPDNYYMEREWRKFGNMQFKYEDVGSVLVSQGFGERIAEQFPQYKDRVSEL